MGGFAAAVGTAAVYPLDLVKTRMQVDPGRFASALQCASAAVGGPGGVRGLYAGMGAQLLGVAPEKSLKLLAYTAAHAALLDYLAAPHGGELPFGWEALAGCAAGCAQTLVACPLEAMKIPLQMAGAGDPAAAAAGAESSSPPPSVAAIAAGLGLRGLFRGVGVCLLRDAASGALFFACFAAAKHFLRAEVPGLDAFVLRLVAGTAAGVPAALLTTPLDVVKTRMQAEGVAVAGAAGAGGGGGSASASALETAAEALRSGGLAALWLGAGERAARMAPSLGITLAIYQALDGID